MGHLYYTELGNKAFPQSGYGLAEKGDFQNLQPFYWSGTQDAANTNLAWLFRTNFGDQGYGNKTNIFFALAVRPGDVSVTVGPEPISSTLFLVGGATLGFRRFRKTITN